jgi:hypothetical protein
LANFEAKTGCGIGTKHSLPKARTIVDWGRIAALAVLGSGVFVESLSLSPNEECWQRNYKGVRIELN